MPDRHHATGAPARSRDRQTRVVHTTGLAETYRCRDQRRHLALLQWERRQKESATWGPWRFRTSPFRSVAVEETTLLYQLNRYARGRVPALQFISDAARAAAEMRRVVRPGGTVTAAVWVLFGSLHPHA
jgi:hypothetical protein